MLIVCVCVRICIYVYTYVCVATMHKLIFVIVIRSIASHANWQANETGYVAARNSCRQLQWLSNCAWASAKLRQRQQRQRQRRQRRCLDNGGKQAVAIDGASCRLLCCACSFLFLLFTYFCFYLIFLFLSFCCYAFMHYKFQRSGWRPGPKGRSKSGPGS